ncbi:RNA-binding protein Rsf1-like [Macrosteles quadrilineatus]|uniref:RNA-binding protein Rsf1-like n=1 Tax=Macrosteles quadrilineatus TaxID=74068 RepID=UPI0023E1E959|nr:RNA-binding protein Rsf1-like [Macrosteles quadrilineatus]
MYRSERPMSRGTRVYVGGLVDTKKEELEAEFEKYGKLNSVWVAFNPPGFAFVEFSNRDDAEAACDNLNDSDIFGSKIRVEISRGRGRGGFRGGRGMDRGGRGDGGGGRGRGGFRGRGGGGYGGGFDRDEEPVRKSFRGSRGGSRFDDFGGGGGRRSDYADDYDGGREVSVGRGGFGGRGRSFDSPREFRGRGRGGSRGYSRGGGGDYGGRVSNGDYSSGDYGGPRNTSRFRSRSPVNRGSRQAY